MTNTSYERVQEDINDIVERAEYTGNIDMRGRLLWKTIKGNIDLGFSRTQQHEQYHAFLSLGLEALDHLHEFYDDSDIEWSETPDVEDCQLIGKILVLRYQVQSELERVSQELRYNTNSSNKQVGKKREIHKAINGW
jgi:hypothetical protein